MRVLIIGCGYVGLPLAVELIARGHTVVGIRRSEEGAAALASVGVEPVVTDITRQDFSLPPGPFDGIVFAAAGGAEPNAEAHRAVHGEGLSRVLAQIAPQPPAKFIYASSTDVYGQQGGVPVKESSPIQPRTTRARTHLEAEGLVRAAAKAGIRPVILRTADLYGGDRLPVLDRFLKNEVRIEGQGTRHLNMIHRDDAVSALIAALRDGRPGECYNVVDQEPVTEMHFYTWMAETLGKWVPATVPASTDPTQTSAVVDQKVSNRRLTMELGCRLKYPNFRLGYTAEFKRLGDAGMLEVPREER